MKGPIRRNPRRDSNEAAIRAVLHKAAVITWPLSGEGIPDLLCLTGHHIFLMEIKRDSKALLTPAQIEFRDVMVHHNAGYYVVWDADTALMALRDEMAR